MSLFLHKGKATVGERLQGLKSCKKTGAKNNQFGCFLCPMKLFFATLLLLCLSGNTFAQYNKDLIQTGVVLNEKRQHFDAYLKEEVINKTFAEPLDSDTEYKYESAVLGASQFMIQSAVVKAGFDTLFLHYDSL